MRIRTIDWARGLVMMLMTVDHAGNVLDEAHLHGDSAARWVRGTPLPPAEFLTRWITHLCAPTFVLLAGASLALSADKRRDDGSQTGFIVRRGLFIALLDPTWMSFGFAQYRVVILQVLYAIGLSLVAMAWLRRLSSRTLLGGALAIQLLGELASGLHPTSEVLRVPWALALTGGPIVAKVYCAYPVLPWLSIMMFGWVLGRWLLEPRSLGARARSLVTTGAILLALFGVVRGVDGYGNWNLHRDSLDALQWLHVSKYPPSVSFTTLELGIAFLILGAFTLADGPDRPRPLLAPLALFGSTAFFYYLLHVHLIVAAQRIFSIDPKHDGLAKTWLGAALTLVVLAAPTWLYRRYKRAHPNGLARYV